MESKEKYLKEFSESYEQHYAYKGVLTHATITKILTDIKSNLTDNYVVSGRIYSIVNELLENSLYHQLDTQDIVEIIILKNEVSFRILTFNSTSSKERELLIKKAEFLNSSDLEVVRKYYKDILMNNSVNNKGTIGIGLNLVRIKSKNQLLISMEEFDDRNIVIVDIKVDI